jgi:hypothetical protein
MTERPIKRATARNGAGEPRNREKIEVYCEPMKETFPLDCMPHSVKSVRTTFLNPWLACKE